jgi:prepilin-type processing-associated H-X9-DG protein
MNGTNDPSSASTASSEHSNGVNVLFGDGHITFVSNNVELVVWRAFGSRNGER